MNRAKIALTGVGGFGARHVAACEALVEEGLVELVAFAEPNDAVPAAADLRDRGVHGYPDYEEMLACESGLDIVCIATPTFTHHRMAAAALRRGLHVFLEKPPCLRIQDLRDLITLEEDQGGFCCVGFHDTARAEIIALKRRLCEGAIGPVREIRAHARWRRNEAYYTRNAWAGKVRLGDEHVLDGPMNNSCAHVLNLCAYLAGSEPYEFARPDWVQGELYRVAPIEGEDTNCLRAHMNSGVEICIHLTQAASVSHAREWLIIGEKGEAWFDDVEGVRLPSEQISLDGRSNLTGALLRRLVEVILGSDEPLLMPLAETEGFLLLSNGAYESAGRIVDVPRESVVETHSEDGAAWTVEGIDEMVLQAARAGQLLSEARFPGGVPTKPFKMDGYEAFPCRWRP